MKNNTIDLIKVIENHFMKYKNFYISILLSLIIIFCWCKFNKKILNQIDIKDDDKMITEIDNILTKIN